MLAAWAFVAVSSRFDSHGHTPSPPLADDPPSAGLPRCDLAGPGRTRRDSFDSASCCCCAARLLSHPQPPWPSLPPRKCEPCMSSPPSGSPSAPASLWSSCVALALRLLPGWLSNRRWLVEISHTCTEVGDDALFSHTCTLLHVCGPGRPSVWAV